MKEFLLFIAWEAIGYFSFYPEICKKEYGLY